MPAGNAAGATLRVPVPPVLALREVHQVYGSGDTEVHALRGVTLSVEQGDYVAVMGASGSGKSTLMNLLGCLDVPTSGGYWLDGLDVGRLSERDLSTVRNRRIGFVFQSFNLIPRMSAAENVELPLVYAGVRRSLRRERVEAALAMVGLSDRARHRPSELSGGQQQRVAVARALVTAPALLLADEPTGNLDSVSTEEVLRIFDDISLAGRTIVVITHENEVAHRAKRIVHMRDGVVVADERRVPVGAPPPGTVAPGTVPPGTVPPGTVPPGVRR